jgi:ParB family chromosome partitioning protein
LLKLDPIIQTGMRDGFLTMGHGRALITIENLSKQLDIYERIIRNKLSVRQTEQLVKSFREDAMPSENIIKLAEESPKYIRKGITSFSEYFGHKVEVKLSGPNKGKIVIPFHSEEDFNRIKKLVQ